METNINAELIEKAKQARSAEELLSAAKANGIDLTEDAARAYFEQLNKSGGLSDDELSNVAGGGCGTCECPFCGYPIAKENGKWLCRNCGKSGGK